jgi:hypothetical protein
VMGTGVLLMKRCLYLAATGGIEPLLL